MAHFLACVPTLLAFNAKKGETNAKGQVQILSVTNATQLKEVFFSGDPWIVQCATEADVAAAAVDQGLGLHEVLELALNALHRVPSRVGLLDCGRALPSGKSTLDRFKFDAAVVPTIFFVANGRSPAQIVPSLLAKYGTSAALFPTPRQQAAALLSLVKVRCSTHEAAVRPSPSPSLPHPLALASNPYFPNLSHFRRARRTRRPA